MASHRSRTFPEDMRILFTAGRMAGEPDPVLLERFASR